MSDLFSVLRHRDYRLLWLAGLASVLGDRIVTVALALFVIDLTGDATDLGLVLAAHSIPLVALMLVGGVWADRVPRHKLMVVTDLVRFALHALLAVLIISGEVEIWHVVVIEALFGCAEAFFRPASTALIPQTVPEDEVQEANALVAMSNNVAEFVGPALATALVLGVGAGEAFAVDAATFLVSAALLVRMSPRRRDAAAGAELAGAKEGPEPESLRAQLAVGYREVRSRTWVWSVLVAACALVFTGLAPWYVLGPVVAEQNYGGTDVYGIVTAALGAGTIVGAIVGIRWRPRFPMRDGLILGVLWCPMGIAYAFGAPLEIVLPAAVVGGFGFSLFDVWWLTALAERIPPDRLSRVTSYDWMVSLGLLPVGYLLAGPLADELGAVEVLAAGSAVAMGVWLLALIPRETRRLERIEPAAGITEAATGERRVRFPDV